MHVQRYFFVQALLSDKAGGIEQALGKDTIINHALNLQKIHHVGAYQ